MRRRSSPAKIEFVPVEVEPRTVATDDTAMEIVLGEVRCARQFGLRPGADGGSLAVLAEPAC